MNNHYVAFTIGPIYATLEQARKTRELWAGSYIFSALMRELLKAVGNQGVVLSPIVDPGAVKNGAGVYPDRCFIQYPSEMPAATIQIIIEDALKEVNLLLNGAARNWLKDYFRIYVALIREDELQPDESPILRLNTILDTLELQTKVWQANNDLIDTLDSNIDKLYVDGLGNAVTAPFFVIFDQGRQKRLLSLLELATSELKKHGANTYTDTVTNPISQSVIHYQRERAVSKKRANVVEKEQDQQTVTALKNYFGNQFKFRHKYLCFVKADGDNMGKLLNEIGPDVARIQTFSRELGIFSKAAVDKIAAYGGIPVYAGGDDLLFIAPLQNEGGDHIFDLIKQIEAVFPSDQLAQTVNGVVSPSLSFGVSVTYYKYPMSESLSAADELLFSNAKSVNGKNAVAFSVQKHSGQTFGTAFAKHSAVFRSFTQLLKACQNLENSFLTSVMHKLTDMKPFLEDALQNDQTIFFFKHHFNEKIHSQSQFDRYLTSVRELCQSAWIESNNVETTVGQVFAALRFVQFLNQEDHE